MNERIVVPAAGLEQEHLARGGLAQAIGENTTGRSGADNDVIVFLAHANAT